MTGTRQAGWARSLLFLAAVFAGMQLIFLLGVVAGEAVPDRWVADALVDGIESGQLTAEDYETTSLDNRLDQWTECVALTIGLGDPEDSFPAETALTNPTLWKCSGSVPLLLQYQESGGIGEGNQYFRYWHGYTVFTRPLLATVGLDGLRLASWGLLLAASFGLVWTLGRSVGWLAPAILMTPLVLTSDFAELPLQIPHVLSMAVALAGGAAAWWVTSRSNSLTAGTLVGLVSGGLFAYVDLLTNPPLAMLAATGLAMAAAFCAGRSTAHTAKTGAAVLAGWLFGFAGSWFVKWLLVALVLGFDEVWDDIQNQIRFRVEGSHELVDEAFGAAIRDNLDYWLDRPLMAGALLILALGFVIVSGVLAWRAEGWSRLAWLLLLALPALLPLIWYEALSNQSQIHEFFAYRSLPFALGYVLLVAYLVAWRGGRTFSGSGWR